jgi:NAD+ synthase/NAD+ synthase (glutamine-hydrolysing)
VSTLRIALAQANFLVGDVGGNTQKVLDLAAQARAAGSHLLLCPELALSGYPPEDLLFHRGFRHQVHDALEHLRDAARGLGIVVGYPEYSNDEIYNSCALLDDGVLQAHHRKARLPNYRVFDEKRYFAAGTQPTVIDFRGFRLGLLICEDVWEPEPAQLARSQGAEILLVINASPYELRKQRARESVVRQRVLDVGLPVVSVNLVGGQDELVFDGHSFAMDAQGEVVMRAPAYEVGLYTVEFVRDAQGAAVPRPGEVAPELSDEASVYGALVLGVRDYVTKHGFPGVVMGLSGGIDSALTLAIAVDALGADRVRAVMMPSPYTADISLDDSRQMVRTLGVRYDEIPIAPAMETYAAMLAKEFAGLPSDTTEENLQARIRGNLLMALSNKTGALVLTTGNKSEMAVGYCTLYGDMAGGFAVIKDVFKTFVYRLSRWVNREREIIPDRIITRPPSAELKPDQTDQDSLPPYEVLDAIMQAYMERDESPREIIARGYAEADVCRVVRLLRIAEYKRRQAPVGIRVTQRGFGKDWRYPITNRYADEF